MNGISLFVFKKSPLYRCLLAGFSFLSLINGSYCGIFLGIISPIGLFNIFGSFLASLRILVIGRRRTEFFRAVILMVMSKLSWSVYSSNLSCASAVKGAAAAVKVLALKFMLVLWRFWRCCILLVNEIPRFFTAPLTNAWDLERVSDGLIKCLKTVSSIGYYSYLSFLVAERSCTAISDCLCFLLMILCAVPLSLMCFMHAYISLCSAWSNYSCF